MFALISDVFFGSKTYLLGDNVTRFAFATTPNNEIFFRKYGEIQMQFDLHFEIWAIISIKV